MNVYNSIQNGARILNIVLSDVDYPRALFALKLFYARHPGQDIWFGSKGVVIRGKEWLASSTYAQCKGTRMRPVQTVDSMRG